MVDNRVLNVIHVNRRDGLKNWETSPIPLRHGELALGYDQGSGSGDGMLAEIRAGHVSGVLTWSELGTYVPVFPVIGATIEQQVENRKDKVLGYDENGVPALLPRTSGALTIISKSEGITIKEEDDSTLSVTIDNDGWEITAGGAIIE